jgi:hypothetical protein
VLRRQETADSSIITDDEVGCATTRVHPPGVYHALPGRCVPRPPIHRDQSREFIATRRKAANSSRETIRNRRKRDQAESHFQTLYHSLRSSPMYGTSVWNTTISVIHFDEFAAFESPNRMQGPRATGENPDHLALLGPNRALNRSK